MHKRLAIGATLTSLVLAGCGGGNAGTNPPPVQSSEPSKSARSAPSKSVELAEKCSIITEQQAGGLGADQPPKQRDSDGQLGCIYQKGQAGTPGWLAFVAADGKSTFKSQVDMREAPTKTGLVAGYPVAEFDSAGRGCTLFADVSDHGHLIVNISKTSTADPGVNLCQHSEKLAEEALQNLPNG